MLLRAIGRDKLGGEPRDRFLDQRLIRGWEAIVAQSGRVDPMAGLAFAVLDFAGLVDADEGVQADQGVGVVVLDGGEATRRPGPDGQLLVQLAVEALLKRLAFLALSAGELPIPTQLILILALANEYFSPLGDDGDGSIDAGGRGGHAARV